MLRPPQPRRREESSSRRTTLSLADEEVVSVFAIPALRAHQIVIHGLLEVQLLRTYDMTETLYE